MNRPPVTPPVLRITDAKRSVPRWVWAAYLLSGLAMALTPMGWL